MQIVIEIADSRFLWNRVGGLSRVSFGCWERERKVPSWRRGALDLWSDLLWCIAMYSVKGKGW
jgi:hypothetical protein